MTDPTPRPLDRALWTLLADLEEAGASPEAERRDRIRAAAGRALDIPEMRQSLAAVALDLLSEEVSPECEAAETWLIESYETTRTVPRLSDAPPGIAEHIATCPGCQDILTGLGRGPGPAATLLQAEELAAGKEALTARFAELTVRMLELKDFFALWDKTAAAATGAAYATLRGEDTDKDLESQGGESRRDDRANPALYALPSERRPELGWELQVNAFLDAGDRYRLDAELFVLDTQDYFLGPWEITATLDGEPLPGGRDEAGIWHLGGLWTREQLERITLQISTPGRP